MVIFKLGRGEEEAGKIELIRSAELVGLKQTLRFRRHLNLSYLNLLFFVVVVVFFTKKKKNFGPDGLERTQHLNLIDLNLKKLHDSRISAMVTSRSSN